MSLLDRISVFLSTGFGVSLLYERFHGKSSYIKDRKHIFKGTGAGFFGTLEAFVLSIIGVRFEGWLGLLALSALTLLSVFFTGRAEKALGTKDDSRIVLDEVIGYFWTVSFIPFALFTLGQQAAILAAGFVLFRLFDVYKIPSRRIQDIGGGWGVMMDDVLSGITALAVLSGGIGVLWALR